MSQNEEEAKELTKRSEQQAERLRKDGRKEIFEQNRVENGVKQNEKEEKQIHVIVDFKDYYIVDLRYRTEIEEFLRAPTDKQDLPYFIKAICEGNIVQRHYGVIGIQKILSRLYKPPIQQVIDTGIVLQMVKLSQDSPFPQIQVESVRSLANITAGTSQQCQYIIKLEVIPIFLKLLRHQPRVAEQAIHAIGNIAKDSVAYRDYIIDRGGLLTLVSLLSDLADLAIISNCCRTLSHLCRGNPLPIYEKISTAMPVLCQAVGKNIVTNKSIIADCCWAIHSQLRNRCEVEEFNSLAQIVINSEILPTLLKILSEQLNFEILVPSLKILLVVASGSVDQLKYLLQQGILRAFMNSDILNFVNVPLRQAWLKFNLLSQAHSQSRFLRQNMSYLFLLVDCDDVKLQIWSAISNMAKEGDPKTVYDFYTSVDIIPTFISLLQTEYKTEIVLRIFLSILFHCEKVGGINNELAIKLRNHEKTVEVMKMRFLHKSDKVTDIVSIIVEKYLQTPVQQSIVHSSDRKEGFRGKNCQAKQTQ